MITESSYPHSVHIYHEALIHVLHLNVAISKLNQRVIYFPVYQQTCNFPSYDEELDSHTCINYTTTLFNITEEYQPRFIEQKGTANKFS